MKYWVILELLYTEAKFLCNNTSTTPICLNKLSYVAD